MTAACHAIICDGASVDEAMALFEETEEFVYLSVAGSSNRFVGWVHQKRALASPNGFGTQ